MGYHNGDYVSLCWWPIMVIFSNIMPFQKYIVKDLWFYNIQCKKRKQSIILLCCKGFPHITLISQMADCVWNHPIMHCKPLSIEYGMYAYWLCLLECMNLRHYIRYAYKISGRKSLGNFYLYRFYALSSFLNKICIWFLSLSCQMATQEFFLILGPWLWQIEPHPGAHYGILPYHKEDLVTFPVLAK